MISPSPTCCPASTIKRRIRLLLAVPVCIAIASCDSASSSTNTASTQGAPMNSAQNIVSNNNEAVLDETNVIDLTDDSEVIQGQPLMATASSTKSTSRSPMISSSSSDSMLQATLMGNYGGVVPCSTCSSTNVTLNLFADGSVLKTSVFNEAETPQPMITESGVYRQDDDLITIVYEKKNIETYQIQDNHLIMMDENKNPDEDYALSRQ